MHIAKWMKLARKKQDPKPIEIIEKGKNVSIPLTFKIGLGLIVITVLKVWSLNTLFSEGIGEKKHAEQ